MGFHPQLWVWMTEASDSKFWPIVRLLAFFAGIFAFIPGLSLVDAGYPTLGYTMAWLTPLTWLIFFVGLFLNRGRDPTQTETTPASSADLESLDPIAAYNQGAALFANGSYRDAGHHFAHLLDEGVDERIRMASAYACQMCTDQSGQAIPIPDDLMDRSDEVGVCYLACTAAGLFFQDGLYAAVNGGRVDLMMGGDGFELEYASTLNVFSVDIHYISNSGVRTPVDNTSTEPPKGKLAFVLNTAHAAGSGHHPPVEIPASGFPTSLPG